jgi:enoyl-CoA hydratase
MDTKEVKVSHNGPVTIISINRPHVRNAINKSTAQALKDAWLDFEADENALVGILSGGDKVFCAGADLNNVDELVADVEGEMGPLGFTRLFVSKPTIAAVAGFCVAGGLEIACWCDLRIADETAVFGCFERRFGIPLVDGGTQRLPQIIGLGRALEMILTGKPVSAKEALVSGLVNEVVAPGKSLKRAVELAQVLAKFPQMCIRNDRQAVYAGLGKELPEGLLIEARLGMETMKSGEPFTGSQEFKKGRGRKGKFQLKPC